MIVIITSTSGNRYMCSHKTGAMLKKFLLFLPGVQKNLIVGNFYSGFKKNCAVSNISCVNDLCAAKLCTTENPELQLFGMLKLELDAVKKKILLLKSNNMMGT